MNPFREYRKLTDGSSVQLTRYRGKVVCNGKRRKVVLFTDLRSSERELARLQREADAEMQDGAAEGRRKHGLRPIDKHVSEYVAWIPTKSEDHRRITKCMLNRLVKLAGWSRVADISVDTVESGLRLVEGTVSYKNGFIKKIKAFVRWLVPERLAVDPLAKLRRRSEVRAERHRARRAGTDAEIAVLMVSLPAEFHLAVCVALLAGLRRAEAGQLCWGDLRLNGVIPFIQLRPEWTKNSRLDALPLHPELVRLLRERTAGLPATPVLHSVPDVVTLRKYLEKSGGKFVLDGLRLDFHALRHTFATNLDRTGASETSKRRLLRHSVRDVTGGYSHAELKELHTVVCRLPSPFKVASAEAIALTGTDGIAGRIGRTPVGQELRIPVHPIASQCTLPPVVENAENTRYFNAKSDDCPSLHAPAPVELLIGQSGDILSETRPSTQAD